MKKQKDSVLLLAKRNKIRELSAAKAANANSIRQIDSLWSKIQQELSQIEESLKRVSRQDKVSALMKRRRVLKRSMAKLVGLSDYAIVKREQLKNSIDRRVKNLQSMSSVGAYNYLVKQALTAVLTDGETGNSRAVRTLDSIPKQIALAIKLMQSKTFARHGSSLRLLIFRQLSSVNIRAMVVGKNAEILYDGMFQQFSIEHNISEETIRNKSAEITYRESNNSELKYLLEEVFTTEKLNNL